MARRYASTTVRRDRVPSTPVFSMSILISSVVSLRRSATSLLEQHVALLTLVRTILDPIRRTTGSASAATIATSVARQSPTWRCCCMNWRRMPPNTDHFQWEPAGSTLKSRKTAIRHALFGERLVDLSLRLAGPPGSAAASNGHWQARWALRSNVTCNRRVSWFRSPYRRRRSALEQEHHAPGMPGREA